MAAEPDQFRQVGVQIPAGYFETALRQLAELLGRPPPELRGYRLDRPESSDASWRVVCTVRGQQVAPVCEDLTFEVVDRTWGEGVLRVLQQTIARLSHDFADRLQGTAFQFVGRRDTQGVMVVGEEHPHFANHMHHTEYLLQHTQLQMDNARARCEIKEMDCVMLRRQLRLWQLKFNKEKKDRLAQREKTRKLRKTVAELTAQTEEMESRIEQLEEEGAELRQENDALLSDSDPPSDGVDMELDDPTDDDEAASQESEHEPLLPSESEEDPEELVPDSGSDSDAVVVHEVR